MGKTLKYHVQISQRRMDKLKIIQAELPSLCSDFFRSISQTTSSLTRLAYAYDLRLFFQYLYQEDPLFSDRAPRFWNEKEFCDVTSRQIEGFQDYLQQYVQMKPDAEGRMVNQVVQNHELGIMRKLCSIRSFFDYLFRNEVVPGNVASLVSLPKRHSKPILYMEKDELDRMMRSLVSGEGFSDQQHKYNRATRERDIAILMLFLGTGIRVSELVGLDIGDLDFKHNAFSVIRKGGSESILYFPESVAEVLKNYLKVRQTVITLQGHEEALFLSLQRRRITTRAVENLVKKYALLGAPLKKRLSPHKLRSTFGTLLYQETGDIYLVADTLGHADVNTTRKHYAAMSDQRKREAAKRIPMPSLDREEINPQSSEE